MGQFNFDLTRQITGSGQSFDRIVALARGGWTWARDLADGLKIPELSSVRLTTYSGIGQAGEPKIVQPLTDAVSGERILLFDEVIESGITVEKAQQYLRVMGAAEIQTAALCYKPGSKIKPDYFAFTTRAWVAFPHEKREFIEESAGKWRNAGLAIEQVRSRLIEIGLPQDEVGFYLQNFWV